MNPSRVFEKELHHGTLDSKTADGKASVNANERERVYYPADRGFYVEEHMYMDDYIKGTTFEIPDNEMYQFLLFRRKIIFSTLFFENCSNSHPVGTSSIHVIVKIRFLSYIYVFLGFLKERRASNIWC